MHQSQAKPAGHTVDRYHVTWSSFPWWLGERQGVIHLNVVTYFKLNILPLIIINNHTSLSAINIIICTVHRSSISITLLTDTTKTDSSHTPSPSILAEVMTSLPGRDIESISTSMASVAIDGMRGKRDGEEGEEERKEEEEEREEEKREEEVDKKEKEEGKSNQEMVLNKEVATSASTLSSPIKILHALTTWTTALLESGDNQETGSLTKGHTPPLSMPEVEVSTKRETFLPPVHSLSVTQVQRNIFMGQLKRRCVKWGV